MTDTNLVRPSGLVALWACLFWTGLACAELKELKPGERQTAAQKLASLLPDARAGWKSSRPGTNWRRSRIEAFRRYRAEQGHDSFTIRYETHSASLNYKRGLLKDKKAAKRRGYEIEKVGKYMALVRDLGHKREIRIWPSKHVLVMAVGTAKLEEIRSHLKLVNFEEVGGVHFASKKK